MFLAGTLSESGIIPAAKLKDLYSEAVEITKIVSVLRKTAKFNNV
jgi:hypothetical protein